MRSFLLRFFKAPTLYWAGIELTLAAQSVRRTLLRTDPSKIKAGARFLNAGCGPKGIDSPDWLNTDARRLPGVDLSCDLGRALPFRSQRFEAVFSEHSLEHLPHGEAKIFLSDCHRMLKPGGVVRISVPDGGLYLRKYLEDPQWIMDRWEGRFATPMAAINRVFRQGSEHQYCYDEETLAAALREAGFVSIAAEGYREGRLEAILIDQQVRSVDSLYMEAERDSVTGQ